MKTTIIIPCFNEADGIPQLCKRLAVLHGRLRGQGGHEFLFVDDGSTDGTGEIILKKARALPMRVITHDRNRGLGAALRTGFDAAAGDEIVTMDSDCTYDPPDAAQLLNTLRAGNDVVTGSPYHPQGEVCDVKRWRLVVSRSLSRLYWLVLPRRLYTYTSCFRAYRANALRKLEMRDDGFLAVTELLASAILGGMKVAEVPVRLTPRLFGKSKIRLLRVSASHLLFLARIILVRLAGTHHHTPGQFDTPLTRVHVAGGRRS